MNSPLRLVAILGAGFLAFGLSPDGRAGSARGGRVVLSAPGGSVDSGGSGLLRIHANRRGERMRLKVRGLDASGNYEVRRRGVSEALGSFLTGPSGSGGVHLRSDTPGAFCGMEVEVTDVAEGTVVLEGEEPLPEMHGDEAGDHHGGDADHHDGDADHHDGDADHHDGDADHHDGDADHHDGDADHHDGGMSGSGGGMHGSGMMSSHDSGR